MATRYPLQEQENIPDYLPTKPEAIHTPAVQARQPLSSLQPNASSPRKAHNITRHASPEKRKSPLKRSSISILDSENGFTYFKRRRLSGERNMAVDPALYANTAPQSTASPGARKPAPAAGPTPTREREQTHVPSARKLSRAAQELISTQSSSEDSSSSDDDDDDDDSERGRGDGSQHSFTSLINYEPSSQTTGATPRIGFGQKQTRGAYPSSSGKRRVPPASRRTGGPSGHGALDPRLAGAELEESSAATTASFTRADTLRLRLRVALYKVLTGQTFVPFQRLRAFRAPEGMRGVTPGLENMVRGTGSRAGQRRVTVSESSSGEETVLAST